MAIGVKLAQIDHHYGELAWHRGQRPVAAGPRRLVRKGIGDGGGERLTRVMSKDLDPVALSRSILLSKKGGTGKNRCRQSVVHREIEEDEFKGKPGPGKS